MLYQTYTQKPNFLAGLKGGLTLQNRERWNSFMISYIFQVQLSIKDYHKDFMMNKLWFRLNFCSLTTVLGFLTWILNSLTQSTNLIAILLLFYWSSSVKQEGTSTYNSLSLLRKKENRAICDQENLFLLAVILSAVVLETVPNRSPIMFYAKLCSSSRRHLL